MSVCCQRRASSCGVDEIRELDPHNSLDWAWTTGIGQGQVIAAQRNHV